MRRIGLHKEKDHRGTRISHGFTLAELLITVAIVGILAAFGFVAVVQAHKNLRLREMDDTAREIFVAAQNHLTAAKASGKWSVFYDNYKDSEDSAAILGERMKDKPSDYPASDAFTSDSHDYRVTEFDKSSDDPDLLGILLPGGAVDATLLPGEDANGPKIRIEYDAKSASIYAVWYTDGKTGVFSSASSATEIPQAVIKNGRPTNVDGTVTDTEEARKTRRDSDPTVGYYGGAATIEPENSGSSEEKQTLTGIAAAIASRTAEDDRLFVKISGITADAAGDMPTVQIQVTGVTSGISADLIELDTDKTHYTGSLDQNGYYENAATASNPNAYALYLDGDGNYYCLLDSVSDGKSGHFAYRFPSLIPGEDLDITVTATLGSAQKSIHLSCNSLFASVERQGGGSCTAKIMTPRHLQNLSCDVSKLSTDPTGAGNQVNVISASLAGDLDWSAFYRSGSDEKSWKTINVLQPESGSVSNAAAGCFYSINNPSLLSLKGNGYRLQNFVMTGDANHPVGLFGRVADKEDAFSISNLTLASCSTDNDTSSADTGARALLVGSFAAGKKGSGLYLSNITLTFSGDASVASSSGEKAAGLLVGSFDAGSGTAPLRMQQIRISGTGKISLSGKSTGLLAGIIQNANGAVTLSNITASLGSLSLSAKVAAGGLMGALEGESALTADSIALTLTGNSEAAKIQGTAAAGGFFGSAVSHTADLDNLSFSFSSGSAEIVSADGAAGGLVGSLAADADAMLSQLSLSGASEAVTGKTAAGGLVGSLKAGSGLTADTLGADILSGSLTAQAETAGGLVGSLQDTKDDSSAISLSNCSVSSADTKDLVRGTWATGGLIGEIALSQDSLTLENSTASLYVHATGEGEDTSSAGGLLGALTGTSDKAAIRYCYSGGRTASGSYAAVTGDTAQGRYNVQGDGTTVPGGFLGSLGKGIRANIATCYTTSSVYAAGNTAGSFVGSSDGNLFISNSYSTGLVTAGTKLASSIGFVGKGNAEVPSGGAANAILAGVSGVDEKGKPVANQVLSGGSVASLVYTGAKPFDRADPKATENASPVDLALKTMNPLYPYETITELAGSGAEGISSSMNRHVGDWPTGSQAGTRVTAVNGNKLTIHVALPVGTEYFTMAVEGLAEVSLNQRIYYAPFHVTKASDGTYLIQWLNFFKSKYLDSFTVQGFQSSNDITTCRIAHAEGAEAYQTATGQELQDGQFALAIDLDDLSQSTRYEAGPFAALFSGLDLYPGEDICVRVKEGVEKFATIGFDQDAQVTVNSIYADGSNWTDATKMVTGSDGSTMTVASHTALVANARHLLNLSSDMNLAGNTSPKVSYTAAEQTADIVWNSADLSVSSYLSDITARNKQDGTYQESDGIGTYWYNGSNESGSRIAKNGTFYPIVNSSLTRYDGNGHTISGIVILEDDFGKSAGGTLGGDGAGNAGIFKTVADGFALTDITAEDITAKTPGSWIASAGILVSGTNVSFTNVTLEGSVKIQSQQAPSSGAVPAGGLIGTASGNTTLKNCRVESDALEILGGTSGGLVGSVTSGSLTIDSCLVLGQKQDGQSAAVIADGNTSGASGGLVGNAQVTNLAISNSAASAQVFGASGVSAGGLAGRLAVSGTGSISSSYSAGRTKNGAYDSTIPGVQGAVTSYSNLSFGLGGLIGYASGALTITDSFSTASVLADAGSSGYVNAEGGLIGHAEGGVNLMHCYSTGRVSHTGTAAADAASGAFLGTGTLTAQECAYLNGINAASMSASAAGDLTGVSAAESTDPLLAAGTDTTTANTHPYDSTLKAYPYWNRTTVRKSTDAAETGISFYGDWPVPASPVYAGLLYYEYDTGSNVNTPYYNGYVKAVNRSGNYQPLTKGSMAEDAGITLTRAGYWLAVDTDAAGTDLYLGLGTVANGRNSGITPVALSSLTSSGTITADGRTYTLYPVDLSTFSGADASLYSASNKGADLILLQKDADSGAFEEAASFGYVPFFADTVTVPDGTNGKLPAATAKTFYGDSGAIDTAYGYVIRSAAQLTDLAGTGAGVQYLTDTTGKNIVIEQQLDLAFPGDGTATPVIASLGSTNTYSGSSVTLRSAARGAASGEHYVITGLANTLVTSVTQAGTIQDIRIESSDLAGNGLADTNAGTIQGCILQNDRITGNGLVGVNTGTIKGSRIQNSTVSGAGFVGTMTGGTVTDNQVINTLIGGSGFAQSITGGTAANCEIYGDLTLYSSYQNAFSEAQRRYTLFVGSTIGSAYTLVRIGSTAASPDLTNASDNVAGFAADVQGDGTVIMRCSVTGEVYGKPNAAGFVLNASNGAGISQSYANTIVSAYRKASTDTTVASGFAGSINNGASITFCHALGVLFSTSGRAAGFAEYAEPYNVNISNSYTAVWQAQVDRAEDYSLFTGSQNTSGSGNYAMRTLFVNGLQNGQNSAGSNVTLTNRSGLASAAAQLGGQVAEGCTIKYGTYNSDASDVTCPFGMASGMSAYGDWPPASASGETVQETRSNDSAAKYGLYETAQSTTTTGGPFAIEAVVYRYRGSYRLQYYLTRNGERICSFNDITHSDNKNNMTVNSSLTSDIKNTTWTSDVRYVSIEDYLNTKSAMTGNSKNVFELHYTKGKNDSAFDTIAGSDTTCIITMTDGTVYVTNTVQQAKVRNDAASWTYRDAYTKNLVSAAAGVNLKRYSVEAEDGICNGAAGVQASLRFVDPEQEKVLQNLRFRYDWYMRNADGTLGQVVRSVQGTSEGDFLPFTSMIPGQEYILVVTNISSDQSALKYQSSWFAQSRTFLKVTAVY